MQPGPPPAPQGNPSGGSGFRRTHIVAVDGSAVGASPPPPQGSPPAYHTPTGRAETHSEGSDETDSSDTSSSSSHGSAERPRLQQREHEAVPTAPTVAADANGGRKKKKRHHRHHSGSGGDAPPSSTTAGVLTAGAIDRAFGATGPDSNRAGGGGGGGGGMIVQPTTKEGNDAASMYSMSQSILPQDPRDRLYYRPRRHLMQCYLKRKKDGNLIKQLLPVKSCTYQFFLEHSNDFVLAARQQGMAASAKAEDLSDGVQGQSYKVKGFGIIVFSVNSQQIEKDPRSFVGKLSRRGNGFEVVMYSEGNKQDRKEICAIRFEAVQDGQRRLKVILPAIDEETGFIRPLEGGRMKFLRDGRGSTLYGGSLDDSSSRAGIDAVLQSSDEDDVVDDGSTPTAAHAPAFRPTVDSQAGASTKKKWRTHSLLVREYLRDPRSANIIVLTNKAAKWDSVVRGYQLDFHGRVTKASEKNFQLVPLLQPDKVVMLFGKQGDEKYAVDFRYPLCGLQAAGIAVTRMSARSL